LLQGSRKWVERRAVQENQEQKRCSKKIAFSPKPGVQKKYTPGTSSIGPKKK